MIGIPLIAAPAAASPSPSDAPAPLGIGRAEWSEFTELAPSFDPARASTRAQAQPGDTTPPGFIPPASEQWISIGGMFVDTQYLAASYSGDESGGVGMSFGAWWWQPSNIGGAVEAAWLYDSHNAKVSGVAGDVETWDLMLGGRFGWRTDSDRWVLYGKGGLLYRIDTGDHVATTSSDGFGGYLGAGVELRFDENLALAPEFMWTFADVAGNSHQFVAGVNFVVRF